jgi:hypothetical protein
VRETNVLKVNTIKGTKKWMQINKYSRNVTNNCCLSVRKQIIRKLIISAFEFGATLPAAIALRSSVDIFGENFDPFVVNGRLLVIFYPFLFTYLSNLFKLCRNEKRFCMHIFGFLKRYLSTLLAARHNDNDCKQNPKSL